MKIMRISRCTALFWTRAVLLFAHKRKKRIDMIMEII